MERCNQTLQPFAHRPDTPHPIGELRNDTTDTERGCAVTGQRRVPIPGATAEERAETIARMRGIDPAQREREAATERRFAEQERRGRAAIENERHRVTEQFT